MASWLSVAGILFVLSLITACSPKEKFTLSSKESDGGFDPGGVIPNNFRDIMRRVATVNAPRGHQCNGRNEFPKLTWSNIPAHTEALVLIVENETGGNWVHLNAWQNKPQWEPLLDEIPKLSVVNLNRLNDTNSNVPPFPSDWQTGENSWSTLTGADQTRPHGGWSGPCPPNDDSGAHTYYFKIYALNSRVLSPINNMTRSGFEAIALAQIIADSEISATASFADPKSLTITSSADDDGFDPGEALPDNFKDVVRRVAMGSSARGHQCNGQNEFPKLIWSNVPDGTESLVLIVEDETGSNWVHLNAWYNKPMGGTLPTEIAKLSVADPTTLNNTDSDVPAFPAGWQTGMNGWSTLTGADQIRPPGGWAGACPPEGPGEHTYYFKLYALNAQVDPAAAPIDNMNRNDFEMSPTYMPQIIGQAETFATASSASDPPTGFTLTSSSGDDGFDPGMAIPDNFKDVVRRVTMGTSPKGYRCNGRNEFPKLTWVNTPTEAEALVLIVENETNSNWVHLNAWYNKAMGGTLPTEIAKLSVSDLTTLNNTDSDVPAFPSGWQTGMNGWSTLTGTDQIRPHGGWAGPCPPGGAGAHTYYFKLYALNAQVDPAAPINNMTRAAFEGSATYASQIIEQTEISGTASSPLYVAVGNSGTILSSTNGAVWTSRTSGTANLQSVTYANNTFVAVGDAGTVISSTDGITWTAGTSGTTDALYDIIYTGSRFVAVGLSGAVTQSTDLATWSASTLTPMSGTPPEMSGVTFSSGRYIASAAGGVVVYSTDDFANFTTGMLSSGSANLDVIFANSLWVIVRNGGEIATSMDGNSFSDATSGTTNNLTNINFGRNQFLVVGVSGTVLTSSNGTNWSLQTAGAANLNASVIDNDRYVIVGDSGTILTSSGGTVWANQTSGVSVALTGIAVKP